MIKAVTPLNPTLQSTEQVLSSKRGVAANLTETLTAVGIGLLVLVLGGFAAGAGLTFAQNAGAQSVLDAVQTAQTQVRSETGNYGSKEALTTGEIPPLTKTSPRLAITAAENNFCAVIKSDSMLGNVYYITARTGVVSEEKPAGKDIEGLTAGCPAVPNV